MRLFSSLLYLILLLLLQRAQAQDTPALLPKLTLSDYTGRALQLSELPRQRGLLLVFLSANTANNKKQISFLMENAHVQRAADFTLVYITPDIQEELVVVQAEIAPSLRCYWLQDKKKKLSSVLQLDRFPSARLYNYEGQLSESLNGPVHPLWLVEALLYMEREQR